MLLYSLSLCQTTVFIASQPPNADVYIDGKFIGKSYTDLIVTPGTHTIKLVKGDVEVTKQITFHQGKNPTNFISINNSNSNSSIGDPDIARKDSMNLALHLEDSPHLALHLEDSLKHYDSIFQLKRNPALFRLETGLLREIPSVSGKGIIRLLKDDILYFQEDKNDWARVKYQLLNMDSTNTYPFVDGWVLKSSIKLDSAIKDTFSNEVHRGRDYVRNHYNLVSQFKNSLLKGWVSLGMSAEMVQAVYGEPNSINRTVGSWGVHEQWVYDRVYFYFENGILTSWQD